MRPESGPVSDALDAVEDEIQPGLELVRVSFFAWLQQIDNGYVGRPYLERGAVFVSMGHRLIPDVSVPDACEDVELGLKWLLDHREHTECRPHSCVPERALCWGCSGVADNPPALAPDVQLAS